MNRLTLALTATLLLGTTASFAQDPYNRYVPTPDQDDPTLGQYIPTPIQDNPTLGAYGATPTGDATPPTPATTSNGTTPTDSTPQMSKEECQNMVALELQNVVARDPDKDAACAKVLEGSGSNSTQ